VIGEKLVILGIRTDGFAEVIGRIDEIGMQRQEGGEGFKLGSAVPRDSSAMPAARYSDRIEGDRTSLNRPACQPWRMVPGIPAKKNPERTTLPSSTTLKHGPALCGSRP
jgi:hypothetical protein